MQSIYDFTDAYYHPQVAEICEQNLRDHPSDTFVANQLAVMYIANDDIDRAEELIRFSVGESDAFGNFLLAMSLSTDQIPSIEGDDIVKYFEDAHVRGLTYAGIFAADILHDGGFVSHRNLYGETDVEMAMLLLEESDYSHYTYGMRVMGEILIDENTNFYDPEIGLIYLTQAAKRGDVAAAIRLLTMNSTLQRNLDAADLRFLFCRLGAGTQDELRREGISYDC